MAKVSGPLMSMDASGAFAGAIVFGKWKGRNVVRQLVKPSNPQTEAQENVRNAMRVMAAAQKFADDTTTKRTGQTTTDKAQLTASAPSGQAWNGFLVKSGIGASLLNYTAAKTAYGALSAAAKTAYDTAAAALVPAIPSVAQASAGGTSATPVAAGQVFFTYLYALYSAGILSAAPTAVPQTYA